MSLGLNIRPWVYMDDRALKDVAGEHGSREKLQVALATTALFDESVGLSLNVDKTQVWEAQDEVEHLGLRVRAASGVQGEWLRPRDGWKPLEEGIAKLATLPGSSELRRRFARMFLLPKLTWAVPVLQPPPYEIVDKLRKAISGTSTNLVVRCPLVGRKVGSASDTSVYHPSSQLAQHVGKLQRSPPPVVSSTPCGEHRP